MPAFLRSWFGCALALAYIAAAVYFIGQELQHTGGWINLRGLGVAIITFPSQLTFGLLLEGLGLGVNYSNLGIMGYVQIGFHVLVTAAFVYLIGFGLDRLVRRLFAPDRRTPPGSRPPGA